METQLKQPHTFDTFPVLVFRLPCKARTHIYLINNILWKYVVEYKHLQTQREQLTKQNGVIYRIDSARLHPPTHSLTLSNRRVKWTWTPHENEWMEEQNDCYELPTRANNKTEQSQLLHSKYVCLLDAVVVLLLGSCSLTFIIINILCYTFLQLLLRHKYAAKAELTPNG